jgi:4-hydroxy-3-polyprenylbenzoate decarboxylase/2,5-furandicarboxylate decarboxylase 1
MPYQDFRQFLDVLKHEGELVEIDRMVDLADVGKALKKSYERQGPALLFNRTGTMCPLVGGVYSTRSKALLAFESTEQALLARISAGLAKPIPPEIVSKPAPCQERVLTGNDIDVRRFPIPIYSPKDGGAYITAGITVTVDPETGVPNIGHYRFMILDGKRMSFFAEENHRFGKNLEKCRKLGVKPQAALVIGCDPILAYTCQFKVSDDTNDWHVAGGLRGSPVELVKCKTVDLDVPATAEVVIEFEVDPERSYREGPLGEHTGYYDAMGKPQPAAIITAITHRHNPIFQALLTGKPVTENHILKQIPLEVSFSEFLRRQFPSIERVSLRLSSSVSNYIVIAMKPRYAGEVRQVILASMASPLRPKWVIVVDTDIDVHDSAEVEWAMSFRVQPQRDVFVIDQTPRAGCDPSVANPDDRPVTELLSSAVGIDATMPVGESFPEVADVPGWREFDLPELDSGRRN